MYLQHKKFNNFDFMLHSSYEITKLPHIFIPQRKLPHISGII